jgi:glutaryl-CoA dehydrogenase
VGGRRETPPDLLDLDRLLSAEEREIRERVGGFVDREVIPKAAGWWDRAEFPFEVLPKLAETGVVGGYLDAERGGAGWSSVAYGLALAEIARGSGSLATFLHVQGGLAMAVIAELGSEEQRRKWLPALARCEKIGAFGLTEPEAGSDPGSMTTTARRVPGGYVLDGAKRWIGNGSFADIIVVWARGEDDGRIGGYLVEGDNPGYHAEVIPRKGSQRAVWQTEVSLNDCRVAEANRLPGARGLSSTLSMLAHSRYGVGWDGIGQATDCYEAALAYAKEREQFGVPIASLQLVQAKLAEMATEVSLARLLGIHVGRLKDDGAMSPATVSMFKMHTVGRARKVCALARDVLGGNGILLDYRVMEHMADIEGVYSYEGTNDINTLIVGQALTGTKAFSPKPLTNPEGDGRAERAEEKVSG